MMKNEATGIAITTPMMAIKAGDPTNPDGPSSPPAVLETVLEERDKDNYYVVHSECMLLPLRCTQNVSGSMYPSRHILSPVTGSHV